MTRPHSHCAVTTTPANTTDSSRGWNHGSANQHTGIHQVHQLAPAQFHQCLANGVRVTGGGGRLARAAQPRPGVRDEPGQPGGTEPSVRLRRLPRRVDPQRAPVVVDPAPRPARRGGPDEDGPAATTATSIATTYPMPGSDPPAPRRAHPRGRWRSAGAGGELGEEQGLGEDGRSSSARSTDSLARGCVRAGPAPRTAAAQRGDHRAQLVQERDRAAGTDLHGVAPVRRWHRAPGRGVRRPVVSTAIPLPGRPGDTSAATPHGTWARRWAISCSWRPPGPLPAGAAATPSRGPTG